MSSHDADAALLAAFARGDAEAARQLVAVKLPRILAMANRLLGDRALAEDVAQEAFVRIWRHASGWRPGRANFDTWLHLVVLNLCRDVLRSSGRTIQGPMEEFEDPAPSPDIALDAAVQGDRVAAAVAVLPDRQREAIVLVHYQELGNRVAAELLGISVDALESLLARARRSLRRRLAEGGKDG